MGLEHHDADTERVMGGPQRGGAEGSSLRRSLTLLTLRAALAPALVGAFVLMVGGALLIRSEVDHHVQTLANNTADELQQICEDYLQDFDRFALRPSLREAAAALAAGTAWDGRTPGQARKRLADQLSQLVTPSGAEGQAAVIVSLSTGQPLVWTGLAGRAEADQLAAEHWPALRRSPLQTSLSRAHHDPLTGKGVVDVMGVIPLPYSSPAPPTAALIWRVPLDLRLYACIERQCLTLPAGEIVLLDDNGVVLYDLGHEPGTAFRRIITTPAVAGTSARRPRALVQRDYRGRNAVTAAASVPMTGWVVLAHSDLAQTYSALIYLVVLWLAVTVLLAFIGSVQGRRAAERVVKPIEALSAATRRVALGDLSTPLPSGRDDEVGQMATDFNLMATQVVTTQQQLREALGESHRAREWLGAVISSSPAAIYVYDKERGIQLWNPGAERMFGWSEEEVLGLRTPPTIPANLQSAFAVLVTRVMDTGETFTNLEAKQQRRDGSFLDVSAALSSLHGPEGEVSGYVGVITDVSHRIRAEREHAERRALAKLVEVTQRLLAETTPPELLQRTAEGARELTTAEICTIGHGYREGVFRMGAVSRADHLPPCPEGVEFAVVHGGICLELIKSATSLRLTDEELRSHPSFVGLPEGHVPLRGLLGVSLTTEDGTPSGMILLSHKREGDFTTRDEAALAHLATSASLALQRLEAHQELTRQARELAASNRELEAFSYSVSHDLRAPLRAIDGFSQAVLEDHAPQLDAKGRRYLERVRGAAQRLGELIDDLLQLSRVSRQPMRWQQADLSAMAAAIVRQLREGEPGRDVAVTIQEGLADQGHPTLLHTLLLNLLGNAWKFTGKREQATIEFGCTQEAEERVYFVRDNGAGFDMQYVDKLFIAFQRLHTVDQFPGNGVGLATVQRVINRHGGRVWAEGAVGLGATFHFTLGE